MDRQLLDIKLSGGVGLRSLFNCVLNLISFSVKTFSHQLQRNSATTVEVSGICFLKRESAKSLAYRSSDGAGSVNDIFDHRRGTIRETAEIKDSWWYINLGSCYQLVITNCSLRDGKKNGESALISWQLEGSNDRMMWEIFETEIY